MPINVQDEIKPWKGEFLLNVHALLFGTLEYLPPPPLPSSFRKLLTPLSSLCQCLANRQPLPTSTLMPKGRGCEPAASRLETSGRTVGLNKKNPPKNSKDSKIREIDWSYLKCLPQIDKFWMSQLLLPSETKLWSKSARNILKQNREITLSRWIFKFLAGFNPL